MFLFKISSRISQTCVRRGVHGIVGKNSSAVSGGTSSTPHNQPQTPSTWVQYSISTDSARKPQPPKRPLTAYFMFMMEKQPDLMLEQPDLAVTQITKQAAILWRGLPESERQKYTEISTTNMEKYKTDYQAFLSTLTDEQKEQMKKDRTDRRKKLAASRLKKKLKSMDKPKRTRTAFAFFNEEQMISRGSTPLIIYIKSVAEKWNSLSVAEKEPYMDLYDKDRVRYATEMKTWEDKMKADGHPEYVRGYKAPKPPKPRKRRVVAKKKKAAPKKRKLAKKNKTLAKKKTATKKAASTKKTDSTAKESVKKTVAKKRSTKSQSGDESWMREE